eukprot:CCRYP_020486-RC/>CCRYP_020486-RC protein AED:0.02 eAED:0.02 QI:575/1/1/1/1/0.75/4/3815/350
MKSKPIYSMDYTSEGFASPNSSSQRLDDHEHAVETRTAEENNHGRNSRFHRRHSMTAPTNHAHDNGSPPPVPPSANPHEEVPSQTQTEREPLKAVKTPAPMGVPARLCGPSRSKCGYCGGSRLHVLGVDDGFNAVVPIANNDKQEKNDRRNGHAIGDNSENRGGFPMVNEESTSKSYGLLFDYLPYDTYQELIDRGWRRSGKHLYRPHNFESCCPAISIRLDTTKFASYYGNSNKPNQNEIENTILVGGSKSQKKVGRNLLRALESYNAKYSRSNSQSTQYSRSDGIEDHVHSPGSAYASRVAKMKLAPDATNGTPPKGELATDSKRKSKKSRQESPKREDEAAACPYLD